MPRFAANLSLLFTELPFLERFEAARAAGFAGVEFLFPYEHDPSDILSALQACGLPLVLFNTPPGDWASGERGFAAVSSAKEAFNDGLALVLSYAGILNPLHIHVMSGNAEGAAAEGCLCENLARACEMAPDQSFLIEPLNPFDMPGYFLRDFQTARRVIDRVAAPNLGLQFDAYHAHRITGDLQSAWAENHPQTRHIQIAGHPGRHEPIPSEIDYRAFFGALDQSGYGGFVSAEYHPKTCTPDGLGWLRSLSG